MSGTHAGVYATWEEIKIVILNSEKEFLQRVYSLEETFSAIRINVGPNYFINTLLKGKSTLPENKKLTAPNQNYLEATTKSFDEELSKKLNTEKLLSSRMNNLLEDLSTYIRTLSETSTWLDFCMIGEALK